MLTESHNKILGLKATEVIQALVGVLGAPLVAVIGGVKDTRSVRQWLAGDGPRESKMVRLRATLQIVDVLTRRFENDMIRAWFTGMNPSLGDKAPLAILADDDEKNFTPVMLAARRFVAEQ